MAETRKLAAILVSDVVGYSRLAGTDEDRILARLRALRSDLIDPTIAVHHGRVVKRTGDGSIVEFRSVVDAVRCAIEVQNGMVERNAGLPPERRIEFRMGIHLGDVVEESDGDLMGDGVNIAARLESIAAPGTICLSEQAYWQVKSRLDLAVSDLGPTQLKNIAEPVRVYSLEVGKPTHAKSVTEKPAGIANAPPHFSFVVLPFTNLSGDPSQDYLADGITENLTTELSRYRVSSGVARNTAFSFKGKNVDAKIIGRDLSVRYIIEGSVQRDQNRARVTAQLIDTESGVHVWADRFEEEATDILKVQDQLVAQIINAMNPYIVKAEAEKAARSKNADALDLAQRGWALAFKGGSIEERRSNNNAARALFEQALKADSNEERAISGDAWTYLIEYYYGWDNAETDYDAKILGPADRAIALNRSAWRGHTLKGVYFFLSGRPNEAVRAANVGLAVSPDLPVLYSVRAGGEISLGQLEQAKSDLQHAMRLGPRDLNVGGWQGQLGDVELASGNAEAAIIAYQKAYDLGYRDFWIYANLAAAYSLANKMEEAKPSLAEARRLNPSLTIKWIKRHAEDIPIRLEALRKAGLPEE
jgi:adenylate cyclase